MFARLALNAYLSRRFGSGRGCRMLCPAASGFPVRRAGIACIRHRRPGLAGAQELFLRRRGMQYYLLWAMLLDKSH